MSKLTCTKAMGLQNSYHLKFEPGDVVKMPFGGKDEYLTIGWAKRVRKNNVMQVLVVDGIFFKEKVHP